MMNLKSNALGSVIAIFLALAVPSSGYPQGMGQGMGRNLPSFADYDVDGDGKIVEQEFNQSRAKRISERAQQGYRMRNIANAPAFQAIDRDGDGAIDAGEFSAHQSQRGQQNTP
ncbi:MAG TPA: EF-hand domain-containing protein [Candidatus Competibacter sp.]|nr:EF-hand domain-containing protein [Candidatus Competibacter sp.]HUM94289.1 EF-hand domain-containing protein [Candidatus Competibacter sp.]